jgi:hypothetical protein
MGGMGACAVLEASTRGCGVGACAVPVHRELDTLSLRVLA